MDWFVQQAVNFRRTILKHPNVAPILLEFLPRDQLTALYDNAAGLLTESAGADRGARPDPGRPGDAHRSGGADHRDQGTR